MKLEIPKLRFAVTFIAKYLVFLLVEAILLNCYIFLHDLNDVGKYAVKAFLFSFNPFFVLFNYLVFFIWLIISKASSKEKSPVIILAILWIMTPLGLFFHAETHLAEPAKGFLIPTAQSIPKGYRKYEELYKKSSYFVWYRSTSWQHAKTLVFQEDKEHIEACDKIKTPLPVYYAFNFDGSHGIVEGYDYLYYKDRDACLQINTFGPGPGFTSREDIINILKTMIRTDAEHSSIPISGSQ